ncbi:MAG: ZIP family metal transporter [Candidatus Micrarchaeota archaeon]
MTIDVFFWILGSVVVVSLISLVGIIAMRLGGAQRESVVRILVAFAAGALLAAAFVHLIPEAIEGAAEGAYFAVLGGIMLFFLLEEFIFWHHCHKEECEVKPVGYLNVIGDGVHNFIDGVLIASAYLVNVNLGVITTLGVISHEIPQELGDFGILIHSGFSTKKALFYNFISASTAILGALIGYFCFSAVKEYIPLAVGVAAGGFLYIAVADLLPELHGERNTKKMISQTLAVFFGIMLIFVLGLLMPEA